MTDNVNINVVNEIISSKENCNFYKNKDNKELELKDI